MTDMDFEELDKAVNSLIGDKKKPAPAVPESPSPTVAPKPASSATTRPSANKGRFMDLRHPSSDMRSSASVPPRSAVAPAVTTPKPAVTPSPSPMPAPTQEPEPVEEPAQSPFLPDARVEKRPLGGSINGEPASPIVSKDNPNSPLPEELQNNVMSIEAGMAEDTTESSVLTTAHTPDKKVEETTAQPQTAAYHQPIKHGGKKGPLTWTVWILLLVIIGAAAGAAVYFWVLPLI